MAEMLTISPEQMEEYRLLKRLYTGLAQWQADPSNAAWHQFVQPVMEAVEAHHAD